MEECCWGCCDAELFEAANWLWSFYDETAALDEKKRYDAAAKLLKDTLEDFKKNRVQRYADVRDPFLCDYFRPSDEQKKWEAMVIRLKNDEKKGLPALQSFISKATPEPPFFLVSGSVSGK